jgi:hypothetical protein
MASTGTIVLELRVLVFELKTNTQNSLDPSLRLEELIVYLRPRSLIEAE